MNPSKYSVGPASIHRSTVAPAGDATKSPASGAVAAATSSPLKEAIREHVRKLASPKSEHPEQSRSAGGVSSKRIPVVLEVSLEASASSGASAHSEAVMVKESGPMRGWHLEFVKVDDLVGFGAPEAEPHRVSGGVDGQASS
jgi:hypothetical protein